MIKAGLERAFYATIHNITTLGPALNQVYINDAASAAIAIPL